MKKMAEDVESSRFIEEESPYKKEFNALPPEKKEMAEAYGKAFPETFIDLMSGHICNSDLSHHLIQYEGFKAAWMLLKTDSDELRQMKEYMGPAYPIFKSSLEKCIKEKSQ